MTVDNSPTEPKPPQVERKKRGKSGKPENNLPQIQPFKPLDIRDTESFLGPEWSPIFSFDVQFGSSDFEKALAHLIREPNINSTSLMRTDIIEDILHDTPKIDKWLKQQGLPTLTKSQGDIEPYTLLNTIKPNASPIDPNTMPLSLYLDDIKPKFVPVENLSLEREIVRRLVPRNPRRDPVLNQTCSIFTTRINKTEDSEKQDSILIVYSPHTKNSSECPFYLPPARGVGILYHNKNVSVHYLLYDDDISKNTESPEYVPLPQRDLSDRIFRIAHHLGETAYKHSCGAKAGYKKRVHHDIIIPKVVFQDKYIDLKNKYSKELVGNWVESTDPKKHVFEDLAIAAFVTQLWNQMYSSKEEFTFVDVGCGNGLLVNILIKEGYKGYGIDARARKSWETYSKEVQDCLKEQVIVPKVLLDSSPEKEYKLPGGEVFDTYKSLYSDKFVNVADFPPNTFLIGNHSDELTVWLPLFDRPFIVIPCCSHALSGAKHRFTPKSQESKSAYASLVDHVQEIADRFGWDVEKEVLRIPSTRSTALIGRNKKTGTHESVETILESEGGGDGWVERTMALRGKNPRNH